VTDYNRHRGVIVTQTVGDGFYRTARRVVRSRLVLLGGMTLSGARNSTRDQGGADVTGGAPVGSTAWFSFIRVIYFRIPSA